MPSPSYSSRFYHPHTLLGEEYKSFSSSLCILLHSPVTSSLLGPNILLNTVFSNTPRKRREHFSKIFLPLYAVFPYQLQQEGKRTCNVTGWGVRVINVAKEILSCVLFSYTDHCQKREKKNRQCDHGNATMHSRCIVELRMLMATIHFRSSCKVPYSGPILNKFGFLTSFNTRLHENPSSESLADIRGRTDGRT